MAKRVVQQRKTITREILVEELSALEQRSDRKMGSTAQLFKEYVDSRWDQLDIKFTNRFDKVDVRFDKLERYFEELVGMVVTQTTKIDRVLHRLDDHDRRITALETN